MIRGRELDLLWSGEPDLRTEELGSCASYIPCGVKQVLSQWLNPSDPQQRLQGKSSLIFSLYIQYIGKLNFLFLIHLYFSVRRVG